MKVIEGLIQGTPEWHAHRARHFNASDAPAMLGCSPYKTRDALIRELATGLGEEFTPEQQKRLDDGHIFEKLARPLAEEILGQDLYPLTATEGPYSASFDGLPMDEAVDWEHKSLNDRLRAVLPAEGIGDETVGARLDKDYRVQMEQQCMIAGCPRALFTASKWRWDNEAQKYVLVEARHCWYRPDPALRAELVAGWALLEEEVAAYQPPEVVEAIEVVGHRPDQLPALRSSVKGELVLESNIKEWEEAALAYIKGVRDHELKTDEDFANASEAADWCETSKTSLLGVRSYLMSATGDVNSAVATIDRIAAELDKTRIAFNNAIKARKEARKAELITDSRTALCDHLAALAVRVGQPVAVVADFQGVIKNLKSFASMESKLSAELARAKIEGNRIADLIEVNLRKLAEHPDHAGLFPDKATIVLKAHDDLVALVTARIAEHNQREEERKKREAEAAAASAAAVGAAAPATAPVAAPASAPAPAAPAVRSFGRAPAQPEPPTMRLGEIQTRIAPLSITEAGLAQLGFPAHTDRGAKLYKPSAFPLICQALRAHLAKVAASELQAA
jgi:predicted phage-related endonuclease